jgi:hypothetical protein
VLATLDELRGVGLLSFSPHVEQEKEPHLEVWADRNALNQSAWGMGVSPDAARIWDLLRSGTFSARPSLVAILNILDAGGRS